MESRPQLLALGITPAPSVFFCRYAIESRPLESAGNRSVLLSEGIRGCRSLAVEPVSDTVYWVDRDGSATAVWVASLTAPHRRRLLLADAGLGTSNLQLDSRTGSVPGCDAGQGMRDTGNIIQRRTLICICICCIVNRPNAQLQTKSGT